MLRYLSLAFYIKCVHDILFVNAFGLNKYETSSTRDFRIISVWRMKRGTEGEQ